MAEVDRYWQRAAARRTAGGRTERSRRNGRLVARLRRRQGGIERRGGYMAPHGVWSIGEAEVRKFDGYDKPDLQKAKQLLTAAGVTTLDASATTRTAFQPFGEFVKDQLAKIGINVKLTLADTATAQPVLIRGDFDIGPWSIDINVDDPDAT